MLTLALVGSRRTGERFGSSAVAPVGSAEWALGQLGSLTVDDEPAPDSSPYERDE